MISLRHLLALLIVSLYLITPQGPAARAPISLGDLVEQLKSDPRGPYRRIAWFCPDGTRHPPDETCEKPGGLQHAVYKDIVVRVQEKHGIYLGQILAGTDFDSFLEGVTV